jgi:hypothetical protein
LKARLKKYIELTKKISGWGWDEKNEVLTASEAAWQSLLAAHNDNKKHYGFFKNNSFLGKDKLMQLYADKVATGRHAALPTSHNQAGDSSTEDGRSSSGSGSDIDSDGSTSRRSRKKTRVMLGDQVEEEGAVSWSESEADAEPDVFGLDKEGNEIDSPQVSQTLKRKRTSKSSTRQSTPMSKSKKKDKKGGNKEVPADEQPQREQVKRERSSADKIKAGLDGLSKQAIQSNEIRRDRLTD